MPRCQPGRSAHWGQRLGWFSLPVTPGSSPGRPAWDDRRRWGRCWLCGPRCWSVWWWVWPCGNLAQPAHKPQLNQLVSWLALWARLKPHRVMSGLITVSPEYSLQAWPQQEKQICSAASHSKGETIHKFCSKYAQLPHIQRKKPYTSSVANMLSCLTFKGRNHTQVL